MGLRLELSWSAKGSFAKQDHFFGGRIENSWVSSLSWQWRAWEWRGNVGQEAREQQLYVAIDVAAGVRGAGQCTQPERDNVIHPMIAGRSRMQIVSS